MKHFIRFCVVLLLFACGAILALTRPVVFQPEQIVLPVRSDAEQLKAHVEKLSIQFSPRDFRHRENLDRAADYIGMIFRSQGAAVREQPYEVDNITYKNVLAEFGPSTGKLVVIGAHYDTHGPLPGADDNASDVAGLLELARLFREHPPRVPVTLAAYSLEEMPFFRTPTMGSHVHASALKDAGVDVHLMISLEMIGYFTDDENSQDYPLPELGLIYPAIGNFIAIVGPMSLSMATHEVKKSFVASVELPAYSINGPRFIQGIDFSDHASFWNLGFDALMITDTAFMRNKAYHTAEDTSDRLDYLRMSNVVDGVFAYIHELP
jgi:hypothetical protein